MTDEKDAIRCPDCGSIPADDQKPVAGFDLKKHEDCDIIACLNPRCKTQYYKVNSDDR